jgi:hypothetical protein
MACCVHEGDADATADLTHRVNAHIGAHKNEEAVGLSSLYRFLMEPAIGFEPTTCCLQDSCSTS